MKPERWKIIENAGYIGEVEIPGEFPDQYEAWAEVKRRYRDGEQERLHVDVAHWDDEGGFWSYDH